MSTKSKESKRVKEERRKDHKNEALNPDSKATQTGRGAKPSNRTEKEDEDSYKDKINKSSGSENPQKIPSTHQKIKEDN